MDARKAQAIIASAVTAMLVACGTVQPESEVVTIADVLPKGAVTEISLAYPDFKMTLVDEDMANVSVKFREKHFYVEGVENDEARERLAKYVVQYLEDPNKRAKDLAKRKAYEAADPHEKMLIFVNRMKKHYPDFDYEWVEKGQGNVKLTYGDKSIVIKGVENDGGREEIAHGIRQRQMEIDELKQEKAQK